MFKKKNFFVKILNLILIWFVYWWVVRFFLDSEVNFVLFWIMGEIMILLVMWNLRVFVRVCGLVFSWFRIFCGSLVKVVLVGVKIVKGVVWW